MHKTCKLQTQNIGINNERDTMHIKYVLADSIRLEAILDIFYLFESKSFWHDSVHAPVSFPSYHH